MAKIHKHKPAAYKANEHKMRIHRLKTDKMRMLRANILVFLWVFIFLFLLLSFVSIIRINSRVIAELPNNNVSNIENNTNTIVENKTDIAVKLLTNTSIEARDALLQSEKDIQEMQRKNISILRVNETFQEAQQIYEAQLSLEKDGRLADYKIVLRATKSISQVKDSALKARDELKIFREAYVDAGKTYDLSSMQADYNEIEKSFSEERFEDTLSLIDGGYAKISEIQSSQTAFNLYYEATSKTLKKFFEDNWPKMLIIAVLIVIALILSWTMIKKLRIRSKLKNLNLQKATLYGLIKKLQYNYFETKKISEGEFSVKLEHFKEMLRDIDRQIPLLREDLFKIDKNEMKNEKKWS
ncbi:MAG: hypothetical protein AABX85_03920 [Nanoarchaeota archaeon]